MTKFRAEFSHFMQNFEKMHVNSAIHPIAIASKTVTGQHGSSTVLQQVNVQADHKCRFLGVL